MSLSLRRFGSQLVRLGSATLLGTAILWPGAATAQQRDEQFYYPGAFNWQFLKTYPEAARLFNAFDYGHAVLYERLYTERGHPDRSLEEDYQYLTTDLLVRPPRFAIAEEAVMPGYAKIAWRAKQMFEWAHVLHRQIYDVYADERLAPAEREQLIEQLTDYYLERDEYAFASRPKAMSLMDEQYFSQVFRRRYPKFNGLIWSYHWLQVGLYEPFLQGGSEAEKKAGVQATVARFWSMLEQPPANMPKYMPMTPAIAPRFTAAHPRAAIIFDNLHMMHDIISDILAADTIPQDQKGAMIDEQLDKLQDSTRDVMTLDEWKQMGEMMGGVATMGGPATGLLKEVRAQPTPSPDMQGRHDMPGMQNMPGGQGTPEDHEQMPETSAPHDSMDHSGHTDATMAAPAAQEPHEAPHPAPKPAATDSHPTNHGHGMGPDSSRSAKAPRAPLPPGAAPRTRAADSTSSTSPRHDHKPGRSVQDSSATK